MRAVEDPDLSAGRKRCADAPEVVVRELGRSRCLERGHPAALGIEALEDRPDQPVLAGRVKPLEDEQDAVAGLCVQALLQLLEPLAELVETGMSPDLVVEAEVVAGVSGSETRLGPRRDPDLGEHLGSLRS